MIEERGQTTQDYILGVSIMLLTTTFVLGYLPGLFDSYEDPVDNVDQAQTERAAEYILEAYGTGEETNTLRFDSDPSDEYEDSPAEDRTRGFHEYLTNETATPDDLDTYGFLQFRRGAQLNTKTDTRARPNVNVSLVNSTELLSGGTNLPARDDVDGDGTDELFAYGDPFFERNSDDEFVPTEPAARSIRVVQIRDEATGTPLENAANEQVCDPTCWLIVRVW